MVTAGFGYAMLKYSAAVADEFTVETSAFVLWHGAGDDDHRSGTLLLVAMVLVAVNVAVITPRSVLLQGQVREAAIACLYLRYLECHVR